MSLEDLGNIGEFVAAVAVVVSLIYLALQIRQNTSSVRASTFHQSASSAADFTRAIGEQKEVARILRTGLRGIEQLEDDDDRVRFVMLLHTLFRQYEDFFFQRQAGTLGSESWDAWRYSLRANLSNPGFTPFWELRRLYFTESFRHFVETERETTEPLPTVAELAEMMKPGTDPPAAPDHRQATDE
jgi:hypothetical protein